MNSQLAASSVGEQVQPDDVVQNPARLAVFCKVVEQQGLARPADDLAITPLDTHELSPLAQHLVAFLRADRPRSVDRSARRLL